MGFTGHRRFYMGSTTYNRVLASKLLLQFVQITPRSKAGKILIRTGPKSSFCKNLLLSNMKEGGGGKGSSMELTLVRFSHTISINGLMSFDLL